MITVKGKDGVLTEATKQEYGKYNCSNRCRVECAVNDPQTTKTHIKHSREFFLICERSCHIRAFCTQHVNIAHAERNPVRVESDKKSYSL
jgi:hypothetical protein